MNLLGDGWKRYEEPCKLAAYIENTRTKLKAQVELHIETQGHPTPNSSSCDQPVSALILTSGKTE